MDDFLRLDYGTVVVHGNEERTAAKDSCSPSIYQDRMIHLFALAKKDQSAEAQQSHGCRFRNLAVNFCIYFILSDLVR